MLHRAEVVISNEHLVNTVSWSSTGHWSLIGQYYINEKEMHIFLVHPEILSKCFTCYITAVYLNAIVFVYYSSKQFYVYLYDVIMSRV